MLDGYPHTLKELSARRGQKITTGRAKAGVKRENNIISKG
jgi:hypothetical protein